MNNDTDHIGGHPEIERRAAEWVLRESAGLSRRDREALDDWLRDPRQAEAFAELKRTSELLDGLRSEPARPARAGARRRAYWLAAGLAAAAAVALIVSQRPRPVPAPTAAAWTQTASTDVGEFKELRLPDGSVIGLNTATAVEIGYSDGERRIKLARGEAFFTVAKSPDRPFWVEVGTVSLRAVGTAFNVRHRTDAVEILVQEGKVQVNQPGQSEPLLQAGEKAVVSLTAGKGAGAATVEPVEPAALRSALAWQTRRHEFSDTPLAEVVAEFNRYNRHRLVIDDPELAARTFGGAFAASGFESLVEVLEQSFGVVAERRANVTILRQAR
ncbi:MAG TPA: FecR domain-containing protein [Opitutaceae bacterium]